MVTYDKIHRAKQAIEEILRGKRKVSFDETLQIILEAKCVDQQLADIISGASY